MKVIKSVKAPEAIGPYSQAIETNGFIFTSGQIPMTKDGNIVRGDIEEQTHQVFKNLIVVLEAAGVGLVDVVKVNLFISDMNQFPRINKVYETYFSEHKPARSCVQVAELPMNVAIELEVIARKSEI